MASRPMLGPDTFGEAVHVCQECFPKTLPQLPPEPEPQTPLTVEGFTKSLHAAADRIERYATRQCEYDIAYAFRTLAQELKP